jgi:hypothetical protein
VLLTVRSDEEATVTAAATVAVPNTSRLYRLKKVTRKLGPQGLERKLRLGFSAKALAAVRRALKQGAKLTLKLTVSARDRAGNVRSVRRKVRLRP